MYVQLKMAILGLQYMSYNYKYYFMGFGDFRNRNKTRRKPVKHSLTL